MFALVALPLPIDQAYTYRVPEPLREGLSAGSRVVVPFGNRVETGVVTGVMAEEPNLKRILDVQEVLEDGAAASPALLKLTRWMADYYVCSHGEALRAALPGGLDVATEHRVSRADKTWHPDFTPSRWHDALRYLDAHPDVTLAGWRQAVPNVTLALARRLAEEGFIELSSGVRGPRVKVKTVAWIRLAPHLLDADAHAARTSALKGARQRDVLHALAEVPDGMPLADLLSATKASSPTVTRLVDEGDLLREDVEVLRGMDAPHAAPPSRTPFPLTPQQEAAASALRGAIDAGAFRTFLLHGVTGSGKTEVYMNALHHALDAGKTGLVLVPEIALTPQTVRRFQHHFGHRVAVLHSRLSDGERYDAWRAIQQGHFPIVIGPRSALFAPLENLGVIVVDEEHESSYKQIDPAPRYHARDVAVVRAMHEGALCVLGSATPSLESWRNAQRGKYTLLSLTERVPQPDGRLAVLPTVTPIHLNSRRFDGHLSPPLLKALAATLQDGNQAILLQNRRGYAPVWTCESCGWTPQCKDCAVAMPYHKAIGRLRCHYCGITGRLPAACPECQHAGFTLRGAGTQRIEEELAAALPEARILRMDQDTTGRKGAHQTLLDQFGRGEADILVGTQMVAKGLDFPRVTLVGVVDADAGAYLPDFRAQERSFQLLTQVAGRAGRAERPGTVYFQTRRPDDPALTHALRHAYVPFATYMLAEREEHGFPPFGRLIGIEFRGEDEAATLAFGKAFTDLLRTFAHPAHDVQGPVPALIPRVKRYYRFQTHLKMPMSTPAGQDVVRRALAEIRLPRDLRLAIDVDPVGMF